MPSRPRTSLLRRLAPLIAIVATASAFACSPSAAHDAPDTGRTASDSLIAAARARLDSLAVVDSQAPSISFAARPRGRTLGAPRREWGAIEDTLVRFSVFAPATQTTYLAAVRAKRVLVDIGRVDLEMKDKPARLEALKRVAAQLSPIAPGATFRLRHAWGTEDARVSGYDVWNRRLVATLDVSPFLDSLAKATPALVAAAELLEADSSAGSAIALVAGARDSVRADSVASPACTRDSLPPELLARADTVRDSILVEIAKRPIRIPRLAEAARSYVARVPGCFGVGRVLIVASIRSGQYEYLAERMALVDSMGKVVPLNVRDYRFRVHDDLRLVDVDGDGVDDLAALGSGRGVGGTTVLRLDPTKRVLERAASGFGFDRAQ
jgi:hypothetical protein